MNIRMRDMEMEGDEQAPFEPQPKMALEALVKELSSIAMCLTRDYHKAIEGLRIAAMSLKVELTAIEQVADRTHDLAVAGKIDEAMALAAKHGIELVIEE